MRAVRTHAHENREPATTRWVRAAGADKMRAAAQRAHLGLDPSPIFGTVTSVPREQNKKNARAERRAGQDLSCVCPIPY
jgi:hypothetical protein